MRSAGHSSQRANVASMVAKYRGRRVVVPSTGRGVAPRWPDEVRLKRLGATPGQCREARRRWQELTEAERWEAWDALAVLSDEEIREQLRDMPEAEPVGIATVPGRGTMEKINDAG